MICREMHMSYDELMALPLEVYDVLIDRLIKESEERKARLR